MAKPDWRRWLAPACVGLVTALVFLPALRGHFTNWDDDVNFTGNLLYRGLGWTQLKWMFTTFTMGHYIPLTWMTLGLDYVLWGMDPWGYHLTSLLFHVANSILFYFIARELIALAWSASPGNDALAEDTAALSAAAVLSALLFSIHPLRVESVAWVTARRDVVSGFFALLCLLAYLRAQKRSGGRWRWAAVSFFAAAVLSRENTVMLAPALLVLDVYPLRRLRGRPTSWARGRARAALVEKLPYFAIGAAGGLMAVTATARVMSATKRGYLHFLPDGQSYFVRPALAFYQLAFHLRKTLWPSGLSPIHEIPAFLDPWSRPFLGSCVFVLALALLAWKTRRRYPALGAATAFYAILLLPTLGIVDSHSLAYERFSYLSCLGWASLAGGAWLKAWRAWRRAELNAAAVALLCLFSLLSRRQATRWHDSITLWRCAVRADRRSAIARNNLGTSLAAAGRYQEATHVLHAALPLAVGRFDHPTVAEVEGNLAGVLATRGLMRQAERQTRAALRLLSGNPIVTHNLALILRTEGRFRQAADVLSSQRPQAASEEPPRPLQQP